ncbi:MAG TPA: adenylate/guanylate cyclase domain-containing protein [Candidatus Obscuribacterales bacterium]
MLLSSGVMSLALMLLPPVQYLESYLYDLRLYFQGPQPPHPDLILIHITPSEGPVLLQTLQRLPAGGLKAIGFDTPRLFDQALSPRLQQLAQSHRIPLILSTGQEWDTSGNLRQIRRHAAQANQTGPQLAANVSEGFAFYAPDIDGTVRAQPLLLRYRSASGIRQLPSFAYQIYRSLQPQRPLTQPERYLAYPGSRSSYQQLSLKELQKLPVSAWKSKVLLISDQAAPVRARTPFQASVSPLELHAYALAGLLENRAYVRPRLLNALLPVLLPLLALGVLWLTLKWGLLVASLGLLTLLFSYFTFNLLLFQSQALWLDLVLPLGATAAGAATVLLHFHRTDGQTRRELYSTFRRHLPDQVVRALMEQQGEDLTQNVRRIVSVMFTDIQGFSRMGEKLPPDQIIHILNEYFAAMTEIIFANQGSLDKYIGDGIMAVYGNIGSNNPRQDAHYAVKTALEMQDKMAELQKKWMKEGIRPIQIRIGINTGEALVAHVGHPRRKEVTVIGDTVNTAARIEKLNKQYHTHILISHSTYEYIKDRAEVRPLGEEQLAGKSSSVMVYELKGWKAQSPV